MTHSTVRAGKLVAICLVAIGLAACSATSKPFAPTTTVRVVTHTVYPQLSPINVPKPPSLKAVEYDLPRQTEIPQIVKNTTECLEVAVEDQDLAFWDRCGQFQIDPDSNLFIGLTQENFNNLQYNLETLRQHIILLEKRIELGNSQRVEFERMAGR